MKILFSWDFHGVLEKDNDLAVREICNRIMRSRGISSSITLEKTRELYGLRWYEYFKYLAPSATHRELVDIVRNATEMSGDRNFTRKFIQPNDHARDVLDEIQKQGHQNIVVSNSSPELIREFVSMVGLDSFVTKTVGVDKHTKTGFDLIKEKARAIREHVHDLNADKIVVIGDREEDVLAGLDCGAVAYLYRGPLSKHPGKTRAHHTITDLREVLKEI